MNDSELHRTADYLSWCAMEAGIISTDQRTKMREASERIQAEWSRARKESWKRMNAELAEKNQRRWEELLERHPRREPTDKDSLLCKLGLHKRSIEQPGSTGDVTDPVVLLYTEKVCPRCGKVRNHGFRDYL